MENATLNQASHILGLFEPYSLEHVQAAIESGLITDVLAVPDVTKVDRNQVREVLGLGPLVPLTLEVVATRRLKVLVDYTAPIKKQLKAGGHDNDIPDLTTAKFTGQGKAEQEILFYQFSSGPESDEVEAFFKANNLIPAGVYHAAAVCRDHPDLQREVWMVFLGDVWPGLDGDEVSVLDGDSVSRDFYLLRRRGKWRQSYWFAAVRA